jgi:hypothetical protein
MALIALLCRFSLIEEAQVDHGFGRLFCLAYVYIPLRLDVFLSHLLPIIPTITSSVQAWLVTRDRLPCLTTL